MGFKLSFNSFLLHYYMADSISQKYGITKLYSHCKHNTGQKRHNEMTIYLSSWYCVTWFHLVSLGCVLGRIVWWQSHRMEEYLFTALWTASNNSNQSGKGQDISRSACSNQLSPGGPACSSQNSQHSTSYFGLSGQHYETMEDISY